MASSGSDRQPFDQRYMAFVMLSFCILMLFNPWGHRPPVEPPPADQLPADQLPADQLPAAQLSADGAAADDNRLPSAIVADDDAADGAEAASPPIEAEPATPPQRIAVGSLTAGGSYRMLATLSNIGAAVERIELSSPEFRDLDNRSGYLGALALTNTTDGLGASVQVVGDGTPAAAAGLQTGDVITHIYGPTIPGPDDGGWNINSPTAFEALLAETKPGHELTVTVERAGNELQLPVKLVRRPLALIRPESENILLHSDELPQGFAATPSYRLSLAKVGALTTKDIALVAANEALLNETWTIDDSDGSDDSGGSQVVFRKRLPELRLEIVKRFRLPTVPKENLEDRTHQSYHLDLEVEVVNLSDTPQAVAYTIEGPNGLPIEGWWYSAKVGPSMFSRYGIRDVISHYYASSAEHFSCSAIAGEDTDPLGQGGSMAYIGVDAQYFAAALLPVKASFADVQFRVAQMQLATAKLPMRESIIYNNPTFTVTTQGVDVPPGAAAKDAYVLFAGPKRPKLLAEYFTAGDRYYSLGSFCYYGWFDWVVRAMLSLLHFFYGIIGNYGLAIICLTIVVRGCMVPVSRKQTQSMVKMQELKPEMDRLAKKYKDDRQKQAQAQQELFRKHGVNPLGGCLPIFLQLPIFIGLYRALAVDVELRQAPLISESIRWCSNLAAPDMLYDWSWMWPQWFNNGQGIFALGPFFNILPIASVALILVQQKMFMPPPQNEQMEMQQKMMKYMMGFMAFLFFKMASGLCIYFIASGLWGIGERKLLPKPTPNTTPTPSSGTSSSTTKAANKKTSTSSNGTAKSSSGKKKKSKKRK